MNTPLRALVIGAALMLTGAQPSTAADLYGGSIKDTYVPPPMMTSAPSWYFRLDGAYAGYDAPVMIEDGIANLSATSIDGTWSLGGGVGYYFAHNIRGDLTYEHMFKSKVKGSQLDRAADVTGVREFDLSSHLFLANLYYDFNAGSRFSPYLGVGLGFVRHTTHDGTITGCNCTALIEGDTETDVAGALMAGVNVALRDRLHLDVGYRFLYLGSGTTGPFNAVVDGTSFDADDPTVEDIHAHEVRFGMRYDFR